ncbi:uncharacterized protein LOC123524916 [Mercenaria mercenaria]|uniref:uncharacterized protein LOC123524916 n=1 Tax=Mercenaria mercenaria TaxID=6596 RepID=UPI001E1DEA7C|nr:uncharacterized protein LOC123524916 [Mercenaria mercenaria]XP_045159466.1 uncharacterized protein LOC123524916 [Mercenaria mercenaria]XP_045159467.1 uncharacterized protein LOC123524916 [Mercenaria mercenaria]XP_053394292.1 uncharacterized protein LOC123524916 [Mercenaria mercenaria]
MYYMLRLTTKMNMPLKNTKRFQRTETVINKRLKWLMCLFSILIVFIVCYVVIVPEHRMTQIISQRYHVETAVTKNHSSLETRKQSSSSYSLFENPSNYLQSNRFDVIFKMVYAYFYVYKKRVPNVIQYAYTEHIRVWGNFTELCSNTILSWFDGKIPCRNKNKESDFILSFHKTIESIKTDGFNSSRSRIPLDNTGFLLNGAHRISAAIILSKNACFEHQSYKESSYDWGYKFFEGKGLSEQMSDMVMSEWMKIQLKLPSLKSLVFIVSVFSNNRGKDDAMRKIVKEQCSKDNGILFEREIKFTKSGMRQLITHMYGQQAWLEAQIQQMLSKFNSTYNAIFLFVYAKRNRDLVQCKNKVRKLYNDKAFKSTAQIPDTIEENVILAEMILNPNSIQLMNYAKNASDCKVIAKEVASRSSTAPIKTLPGIHEGRDDVMIDSGTVLGIFGLRQRTDVDLLFLHKVDKVLLGNDHGISIQAHAFKNNSISKGRAWGEDHFTDNGAMDELDLFYDPKNYGYCYGIKFVSLKQLVRYKLKRNESRKDSFDVKLISKFLEIIS